MDYICPPFCESLRAMSFLSIFNEVWRAAYEMLRTACKAGNRAGPRVLKVHFYFLACSILKGLDFSSLKKEQETEIATL